ncbi:SH3 domain-containing protein [Eubacteriales bacterium OttesenSCG-928-A19]|nr:SH3 domain-containing protein [Eubacteriales bacterium OttesenSCG-928-A19]
MKKYQLTGISLVLLICCLMGAGVATSESSQGLVIGETAAIWESPNTASTIIAMSDNGELLTILGEERNWYHIRFDDDENDAHGEGYVLKRGLVADPAYVTALGTALLYAMPLTDAKVVGEMERGDQLAVIGEWEGFWAVNLRTASAFVEKNAVDYSGVITEPTARPTSRPTATPEPEKPVAQATYVLLRDTSLRSAPSANAPSNGTMIAGSYVLIGQIQHGYGQSVENGYWLLMSDLQRAVPGVTVPVETSTPGVMRYLVIRDGTSVYGEPDLNSQIVDTLNDGDAVNVTNVRNGFALVQYGRQRGWVEMSNLLSFQR